MSNANIRYLGIDSPPGMFDSILDLLQGDGSIRPERPLQLSCSALHKIDLPDGEDLSQS
jgi:hypothetical protein